MFRASIIAKNVIAVVDSKSDKEDTLILRSGWAGKYHVITEMHDADPNTTHGHELVDGDWIRDNYGENVSRLLSYLQPRQQQ